MIIYFNSNGDITSLKPERVYQGSNDVDQFLIVAPFNTASTVELTFTLPNGQVLSPYILSGGTIFTNELNIWSFLLKSDITRFAGQVRFGVRVLGVNGKVIATGSDTFVVERGTAPTLPPEPTPDVYEQILELLGGLSVDKVDRVDVSDPDYIVGYVYSKNGIKTPNAFYYNFNADSVIGYNNQTLNNIKGAIFVLDIPTQLRQIEYLFADDLKFKPKIFTRQVYYDENKEVTIVTPFVEIGWDIYGDLNNKITDVLSQLGSKQDKIDNNLQTTNKTVVGAINENKTNIENNYNVLNNNKLDKNFNLLVERTYAQLADFVAVRSGDQTLKMTLQTLRTYLTQGLVGLSFQVVEVLPATGFGNIIYLTPMVDNIIHIDTFANLPAIGESKTLYVVDDEHSGGISGWYTWDGGSYSAYSNGFYEYDWIEELGKYELIGSTQVDLTGYATETWVTNNFIAKSILNGGTTGQILAKKSDNDLDFEFVDKPQAPIQEIQLNGVEVPPVDGVVDLEVSGKKYATIVIGTSTAGYTINDVDYLCDGVDDQVEIQSAIDSLINGGTVVFLSANYNISSPIYISNSNIKLVGNGSKITGSTFTAVFRRSAPQIYKTTITGFDVRELISNVPFFSVSNGSSLTDDYIILNENIYNRIFLALNNTQYFNVYITNNITINSSNSTYLIGSTTAEIWNARIIGNGRSRLGDGIRFVNSVITNNRFLQSSSIYFAETIFNNFCENTITITSGSYSSYISSTNSVIDNSGRRNNTIIQQTPSTINSLQVEKIPTADNDVVRKTDLDTVKNLIPTQVNRYFTLASQTLFLKNFFTMVAEKPTGVVSNKDTTITATTQATAQQLAIFTTTDAIVSEIEFPAQNTEVSIQAYKTSGDQNIHIFARGYVMDNAGNETLLSTSNIATLTTTATNYTLYLPLPEYTAPVGSRAVIEILAYRVSGAGTHTVRISVDDDTMSKWSYSLSLADLKLDAKNISYNNTTSGLTATNVQDAINELEDEKLDASVVSTDIPDNTSTDDTVPTSKAVYGLSATKLDINGGYMTGDLDMSGGTIKGLANAVNPNEAVNKGQLDSALASASGLTLSDNLNTPSSSVGLSTLGANNLLQRKRTLIWSGETTSSVDLTSYGLSNGDLLMLKFQLWGNYVDYKIVAVGTTLIPISNTVSTDGTFQAINSLYSVTTTALTLNISTGVFNVNFTGSSISSVSFNEQSDILKCVEIWKI